AAHSILAWPKSKPCLPGNSMRLKAIIRLLVLFLIGAQSHATTYATWIMVWYGHDQAWWSAKDPCSRDLINGEWKTLDWADNTQITANLDAIKKAGVTVVIADLTNGWGSIMINVKPKSDLMDKDLAIVPGADPKAIQSKAHLFGEIMRENGYTMWAEWLPFEADKYPH
ncbi:MAG TPA: hypothetical protein VFI02_17780, partial [Armatimonadota bacterium]|nr:hypothetical protein [Armatimonadota bacterium]